MKLAFSPRTPASAPPHPVSSFSLAPSLLNRSVEEERRRKNYISVWWPIKWTPILWSEMINLYDLSFLRLLKNNWEFGFLLLSAAKIFLIQTYFWFLISSWLLQSRFLYLLLWNFLKSWKDFQREKRLPQIIVCLSLRPLWRGRCFWSWVGEGQIPVALTGTSKRIGLCQGQSAEVGCRSQQWAASSKLSSKRKWAGGAGR